jgi:hypothetical protein
LSRDKLLLRADFFPFFRLVILAQLSLGNLS